MQRREWKEKRRSDITRVVWILVGFAVIIGFLTFAISHINGGNADKKGLYLSEYGGTVTIDSEKIYAYSISDYNKKNSVNDENPVNEEDSDNDEKSVVESGPYIAIGDLQKFGFNLEVSDDGSITIYKTDEQNTDSKGIGDNLIGKSVQKDIKKISFKKSKDEEAESIKQSATIYSVIGTDEKLIVVNDFRDINILGDDDGSTTENIKMRVIDLYRSDKSNISATPTNEATSDLPKTEIVKPTSEPTEEIAQETGYTIFLDAGHGKSSGSMTDSEKRESGWVQNSSGSWGEWRHWANGVFGSDCLGESCNQPNDCWYPIGNGDRDTEPEINLRNCQAAKTYLEEMGYNVVMSRESNNENPSITRRIENANAAGADIYLCVHSNAGGGTGTSYIELDESGSYYGMQRGASYGQQGNILGKMINDKIVSGTSLSSYSGGCISGEPYLIVFQKAPMQCAYLEIGFFDNANDLSILNSEYDSIGKAIAEGIDEYCRTYLN